MSNLDAVIQTVRFCKGAALVVVVQEQKIVALHGECNNLPLSIGAAWEPESLVADGDWHVEALSQTDPSQTDPSQTDPSQTDPSQTDSSTAAFLVGPGESPSRSEDAPPASESARFLAFSEQLVGLGCFDWDIQANQIRWSDGLYRIYGLEPQEFEATLEAFMERVVPEDRGQVQQAVQAALESCGQYHSVERIKTKSGEIRTLESRGHVITGDQGQPIRLIGVCCDATELMQHKRMQEWQIGGLKLLASSASELLSSPTFEPLTPLFSKLADHLDCEAYANFRCAGNELHLESAEGFPEGLLQQLERIELGQHMCGLCAKRGETLVVSVETRDHFPEGDALWALGIRSFIAVPLKVGDSMLGTLSFASHTRDRFSSWEVDYIQTVAQLVTAAKTQQRYETEIRKAEETSRMILNHAQLVTWEADPETLDFRFVDGSCEELLGFPQVEWMSPGFWPSRMQREQLVAFKDSLLQSPSGRFEMRMLRCDGAEIWVEAIYDVAPSDAGQTPKLLRGVLSNITVRKHLEQGLAESQKMEAVGRLAGGVAHDFNNLLTVISTYSELLQLDPSPPQVEEAAGAIHDASARATRLTSQLLMFGRTSVRRVKVVNLNEAIQASQPLLDRLLRDNVTLSCELQPNLPNVKIDPSHLDQVLVNLAVNARDAMGQGGVVQLTTSVESVEPVEAEDANSAAVHLASGDYVSLTVSDTGSGMSVETQAKAFEPFFTTKAVGQGTGLGLAVVYGVVKECGGAVQIQSEPGQGTQVRILLPISNDAPSRQEGPTPQAVGGVERILLVEDEDVVRRAASTVLREHGYDVVEAANAGQALELAARLHPAVDLLLTDVVMPGMSGVELANQMLHDHPGLRVLCMSGYSDEATERHGLCHAFLQKPFTLARLVEKVRLVIDENSV